MFRARLSNPHLAWLCAPLLACVLSACSTVELPTLPDDLPGAAIFTRNLLTMLAGRNLALTRKIGHMARRTTRDKLISYLSAQALQAGRSEFDIPLDRQQLADFLSVNRSAMSAELSKMQREGLLRAERSDFTLFQPE